MSLSQKKTAFELTSMRRAGQIVGSLLYELSMLVKPGITPLKLDHFARTYIEKHGAKPAFLGYEGYPATLCISVNDVVVHGIPLSVPLTAGDIVGLDAGAIVDGMYADAAITVPVGPIDQASEQLISVTASALEAGIRHARAGLRVGDIAAAIEAVISHAQFGIVNDLTGHGIGRNLHEEPAIPNFGRPGSGPTLRSGMTICLEPMVTLGQPAVLLDPDGWTIRTRDSSRSAHFEHTVLVTDGEPEILTPIRRMNS